MGKEQNSGTASTTLPGIVQKVIPSPDPKEPDKAQIAVEGGDDLYRELRIKNTLVDEDGTEVRLKPGAQVEVTIEAEPQATVKKHTGSDAVEPKG